MSYNVFVIEDHPVIRDVYRQLLSRIPELTISGEAATGAEALQKLTQSHPDIILLDLMLPDVRGIALLKEIKLHHPQVPVIVVSGEEEKLFKPLALDAGASGYIDKLCVKDELIRLIFENVRS